MNRGRDEKIRLKPLARRGLPTWFGLLDGWKILCRDSFLLEQEVSTLVKIGAPPRQNGARLGKGVGDEIADTKINLSECDFRSHGLV
jgi:hypothetical protein